MKVDKLHKEGLIAELEVTLYYLKTKEINYNLFNYHIERINNDAKLVFSDLKKNKK